MRIARFVRAPEGSGADAGGDSSSPEFGVVEGVGLDGSSTDAFVLPVKDDPLFRPLEPTGERVALSSVRLLAPVIPRSKVVGIGRNYAEHAVEMASAAPSEPLLFLKPNTSVVGPGDVVRLPRQSREVHHEAELAVVIGRVCKDVPVERVADVVFGYTCADDVTARDLQRSDGQWARAKGFDTFCPLGPWISTDVDPSDLAISCEVNGEVRQSGRTSAMVHDIPTVVAAASSAFTLLPGDVILTGTPAGVGQIRPGDEVVVRVEGIGALRHGVGRG